MLGRLALAASFGLAAACQAFCDTTPRYKCIVYVPKVYGKVKKTWPLILYLHGRSLRGSDLHLIKRYGLPTRLEHDKWFPFVTVCPQCPPGERWTDTKGLMQLVDHICRHYAVDTSRMYVMGFSMGASGAWRMAFDYPDRFSAIVPVGAIAETIWASSGKMKSVGVWAIHGDQDTDAPYANAVTMIRLHRQKGGEGILTTLAGKGHNIPGVFDRHDIYQWLLRHRRPAVARKS
jgi:predicted peptidase